MESFDLESFVSRLVDDDPSPRRTDGCGRRQASVAPNAKSHEVKKHPASSVCEWDEYNDDRYTFLRQQEVSRYVGPEYLAGRERLGVVTPWQRTAIVDWLVDVHTVAPAVSGGGHPLSLESLFLTMNVVDRFLSTSQGGRVASSVDCLTLEVACVACLGLGLKYEESQPPSLLEIAFTAASMESGIFGGPNRCRERVDEKGLKALRNEIVGMEQLISSALGYRLTVPTAVSFLEMFMRRASLLGYLPEGPASERVSKEAQQILLRVLRDTCSLSHMPSTLAAAALQWASRTATPGAVTASQYAFIEVTGYKIESVRHCLDDMQAIRNGIDPLSTSSTKAGTAGLAEEVLSSKASARGSTPLTTNDQELSVVFEVDPNDWEISFDPETFVDSLVEDDTPPVLADESVVVLGEPAEPGVGKEVHPAASPIIYPDELSFEFNVDSDCSEIKPFDAERFVSRLVEDDTPPRLTYGSVVAPGGFTDSGKIDEEKQPSHAPTTANALFQPMFFNFPARSEDFSHGTRLWRSHDNPVLVETAVRTRSCANGIKQRCDGFAFGFAGMTFPN